jgi:hypothetical protein
LWPKSLWRLGRGEKEDEELKKRDMLIVYMKAMS